MSKVASCIGSHTDRRSSEAALEFDAHLAWPQDRNRCQSVPSVMLFSLLICFPQATQDFKGSSVPPVWCTGEE